MNESTSGTTPITSRYATHLNLLFPQLACVDVSILLDSCTDAWYCLHRKRRYRDAAVRACVLDHRVCPHAREPQVPVI
jgi:hypothetical protein